MRPSLLVWLPLALVACDTESADPQQGGQPPVQDAGDGGSDQADAGAAEADGAGGAGQQGEADGSASASFEGGAGEPDGGMDGPVADEEDAAQPAPCGEWPHEGQQTRTRYQAAQVEPGGSCVAEVQSRACQDGAWSDWSGSYAHEACSERAPHACGASAHGETEARVRYQSASVAFGESCVSEAQARVCDDGTWGPWSGSYGAESCSVEAATDCGGVPNGGEQTRVRYQNASEPYGGTCSSEIQSRTCVDGAFGAWTGSYLHADCTVQGAAECDGTPHGGQQARTRYAAASVAHDESCQSETQVRSCNDGTWSAWSGSYTHASCDVLAPGSCDGTPHGGNDARVRYAAETVPHGESCQSEAQVRSCDDGTWSAWSGTFTATSCSVLPPAACDGEPHGTVQQRVRYAAETVPLGETCEQETQSRQCDDGEWSAWSGSYQAAECEQDASSDPFLGVGQPCDSDDECTGDLTCQDDTATFRSHRQCTAPCANEEACTLVYGPNTTCLSTGVCAARCGYDEHCPTGSLCNAEGWCSRSAPDSGNPYCTGEATRCFGLSEGECDATPLGCEWGYTSRIRCRRAAAYNPCTSFSPGSVSYCDGIGCDWDGSRCVSRLAGTCLQESYGACETHRECYNGGGYECQGTEPDCTRVPVDLCTAQPGCTAQPASGG